MLDIGPRFGGYTRVMTTIAGSECRIYQYALTIVLLREHFHIQAVFWVVFRFMLGHTYMTSIILLLAIVSLNGAVSQSSTLGCLIQTYHIAAIAR